MKVQTQLHDIRQAFANTLNFPYRKSSRIVNGVVIFLVLFSIAVVPIHLLDLVDPDNEWVLVILEKIIVTIFSFEYVLRIWVSPSPIRYIFSLRGLIDLLAILPFYLSLLFALPNPEMFVILRVARLLKFDEVFECYRCEDHPEQELLLHKSVNIMPGEKVEQLVQRHPIVFAAYCIAPLFMLTFGITVILSFDFTVWTLIIGGLLFLAGILFYYKNWIDQNYDIILITDQRVIFQQREVFGGQSNALPYGAIQNVMADDVGIARWLFKYGDLRIETANIDSTLSYKYAPNPSEVVHRISENSHRVKVKNS